jgi:threonine dehydratase
MTHSDAHTLKRRTDQPGGLLAAIDLDHAVAAIADGASRTPLIASPELSDLAGGPVLLKAECLQATGSFKLRGALNRVAVLGDDARAGLVTASAGNHGRAVAQAARLSGTPCEVFMPRDAPVSKVVAVERLGASVQLEGTSVEEALELAVRRGSETGAAFLHPFDDLDVIAGQGTLGLEILSDVPDLARVVVPVGGGGLASGVGAALARSGRPVELLGVQAGNCAPYAAALAGRPLEGSAGATIADGIAIKRPGALTL